MREFLTKAVLTFLNFSPARDTTAAILMGLMGLAVLGPVFGPPGHADELQSVRVEIDPADNDSIIIECAPGQRLDGAQCKTAYGNKVAVLTFPRPALLDQVQDARTVRPKFLA
jgi:hypothetical protein